MAAKRVTDEAQMEFAFDAEASTTGKVKSTSKKAKGKASRKVVKGSEAAGSGSAKSKAGKKVVGKAKKGGAEAAQGQTKTKAKKTVETTTESLAKGKATQERAAGKRGVGRAKAAKAGKESKAEQMAKSQREISVSEFFAKNRHLLGFDNPRKALLTAVKEAVDNSLDACEEAQILPELEVGIKQVGEDRFRMWVQDNGPGIVKSQIPNIFGRLLYGSKFHSLRMARGQQGIGISAAGMYGLLTTGKSVKIMSRTGPHSEAHYYELQIDTKKNRPEIIKEELVDWDTVGKADAQDLLGAAEAAEQGAVKPSPSGTRVEIEMEARFQRGRQSVDEYIAQTAITNPHSRIRYLTPDGQERIFERTVKEPVTVPKSVKPHPYGVELGILLKMAKDTKARTMASFLCDEFSRVSPRVSQAILDKAKMSSRKRPVSLTHAEVSKLHKAISQTKIMAPSTNCVVPIGEEALLMGLKQVVSADFYATCTRPPSVYRGNPFQVEVGLAYGGGNGDAVVKIKLDEDDGSDDEKELMRVLRFANRVPLLYQQSACAVFRSILQTNWRLYGLSQSRGALPGGPATVIVHIASVWVPFTSESKEAVAHYPEIIKEIKLALSDVGRRLGRYLRGEKRKRQELLKRSYIEKYLPAIGEALRDILSLKEPEVEKVVNQLEHVLETTRMKI